MEYYLRHCFNHNLKWVIQYIWKIPSYIYIYLVELDTDHQNLVELLPGFCFDVLVGWPSVPSCSTLGQFMYAKNPNKISPCSISMVFYILLYIHIRDSYTHVVFFSECHGPWPWAMVIPHWESSDGVTASWDDLFPMNDGKVMK